MGVVAACFLGVHWGIEVQDKTVGSDDSQNWSSIPVSDEELNFDFIVCFICFKRTFIVHSKCGILNRKKKIKYALLCSGMKAWPVLIECCVLQLTIVVVLEEYCMIEL